MQLQVKIKRQNITFLIKQLYILHLIHVNVTFILTCCYSVTLATVLIGVASLPSEKKDPTYPIHDTVTLTVPVSHKVSHRLIYRLQMQPMFSELCERTMHIIMYSIRYSVLIF